MAHYGPEQWWYSDGTTAASVRAAVFEGDQSTLAAIFSDSGLSVPLTNPTTTDASGFLEFYAADGDYWIFVGDETYGDSVLSTLGPAPTGAVVSVNGQSGVVVLGAADVGAQPISTINAKGDLYAGTGNDATARRSIGTDGQVLTADSSDPTGMSWQAGGGGGAVTSVNGQTGVVVLTAANVGAAPTTRNLIAGIALSGGGDLSADRTFDVDLGTTAGTAAAGDDSRIVGAQQRSTLTTKGDLYAATAAATVTRQAVGTDGQVLTADSAQSTGIKWATPASAPVTSVNGQTGVVVLTASDVGADAAGAAAAAAAASQPLATINAKGDLYVGTANDTTTRKGVGANGTVLTADSSDPTGVVWQTPAADAVTSVNGQTGVVVLTAANVGAIASTLPDAKGDIITATAADTPARLAVGTNGQALRANSATTTGLEWDTLDAADVGADPAGSAAAAQAASQPLDSDLTSIAGLTPSNDDIIQRKAGAWTNRTVAQYKVDLAYTASDVGAQPIATIDAKGDLYAGTGDNTTARQAVGTDTQVLRANSGNSTGLEWHTLVPSDVGAQPLDSDLTTIAGLTPTNDDIMQYKAGAWANRTIAQVKTDLAYTAAQVGAIANTLVDAKGDIITATANDTPARLPVGSDGQVLSANSAQSTGLEWVAAGGGGIPATIFDAKGDIIAASAADTAARLAVGTDGQYLRAASGQTTGLEYHTIVASDVGAVPTTRTLTAGTAMTGGGDLSADRTFNVNIGTASGTAAAGDDSRITGAEQRSTLTTKGDLYVATASATTARQAVGTDGQVLTADSAQTNGIKWAAATDAGAVPKSTVTTKGDLIVATASATVTRRAVGTDGQVLTADSTQTDGVKWAATGTDAGAQQRSTLTTKGDLYVATGSATTARQGVGTNGYVVIADSAQTNGLKWGTEKSFSFMPRSTGYISANGVTTARSSKAATQNTMFLMPFMLLIDATTSSIAFEITGNVANAVVRLGFYALDATTLLPTGAAVVDFGTTTADTTSTKTFAAVQALTAGGWALAFVAQTAAPTIRHCAGFNPFVASATFPAGTGLGWNNGWVQTGVTGGLPTIGSLADSDTPMCGIKF